MILLESEQDSLEVIAKYPTDHFLKQQFADWLEDHGHADEAEAWRWLAENEKCPARNGWHPPSSYLSVKIDEPHYLPREFFTADELENVWGLYAGNLTTIEYYQLAAQRFIYMRKSSPAQG